MSSLNVPNGIARRTESSDSTPMMMPLSMRTAGDAVKGREGSLVSSGYLRTPAQAVNDVKQ